MDFLGYVRYSETNLFFSPLKVEKNFEIFLTWLTSSDPYPYGKFFLCVYLMFQAILNQF